MERIGIDVLLKEKEENLKKLQKEVGLLRRIDFPVDVVKSPSGDSFTLYCKDYSRATDFKIKKRSKYLSGEQFGYGGGYSSQRMQVYPQFYFNLKYRGLFEPVYIQHEGFEEDDRIVVASRIVSSGWGEFKSENGVTLEKVDLEEVFGFFKEQGVKKSLLDRLGRRINEANEFGSDLLSN
jgi:hypothetical protein